jgi:hypothetical protein
MSKAFSFLPSPFSNLFCSAHHQKVCWRSPDSPAQLACHPPCCVAGRFPRPNTAAQPSVLSSQQRPSEARSTAAADRRTPCCHPLPQAAPELGVGVRPRRAAHPRRTPHLLPWTRTPTLLIRPNPFHPIHKHRAAAGLQTLAPAPAPSISSSTALHSVLSGPRASCGGE